MSAFVFSKNNADAISEVAVRLVTAHLKDLGITVEAAGGRYQDHEFTMKLKLSSTDSAGNSQAALAFKKHAAAYGLAADHLGTMFTHKGNSYQITGLVTRRRKYPIETICLRGPNAGKPWFFTAEIVKRLVAGVA